MWYRNSKRLSALPQRLSVNEWTRGDVALGVHTIQSIEGDHYKTIKWLLYHREGWTKDVGGERNVCIVSPSYITQLCYLRWQEVEVCIPPDVMIGTVETQGMKVSIMNPSGEITCYVEMESNDCCYCSFPSHKVSQEGGKEGEKESYRWVSSKTIK